MIRYAYRVTAAMKLGKHYFDSNQVLLQQSERCIDPRVEV